MAATCLDYLTKSKVSKINENLVQNLPYEMFSNSGTADKLYSIVGVAPRTKQDFAILASLFMDYPIAAIPNNEETCIDHSLILDACWDSFSEAEDFSIWYAARGTGKTYDLSFLSFAEALYKPGCGTTILGGSLEQAVRAVNYFNEFWDKGFFINKNFLKNKVITGRGFKTIRGGWVKALAASPKSIRGEHPSKLRIDEADELDKKLYDASLGQPKMKNGHKDNIIVSSTLHHPFGLMSEILDTIQTIGAKLYKWCVMDVMDPYGFWTKEEVYRKMRQVTKAMWESEYLCLRPKIGDSIFDWESTNRAYMRGLHISWQEMKSEGCIDWGYTCTVLHVIQDMKEFINIPNSYSWEYRELTERCDEIIDIALERNVTVIYCDSSPKDNYITLRKRIKKKRAKITVIPIAFNVWKDTSIDVLRFYLEKNLVNIKDHTFQDKLKKYHYKDVEKEIIDKVDDHYVDAWIAWGATRWRILGYLTELEKEKKRKQEKKTMFNIGPY